jgi:hypothetical protein
MQTYSQTFATATTWELNVTGRYFTTLECNLPVNVRFYRGGQLLDAGDIRGLLAGLEMTLGDINDTRPAFDRVQVDVQAGDTVKIGIGNGQGRYNRGASTVTVVSNLVPQTAAFVNLQKTVTNASAQILAANSAREYLLIQNKDPAGTIWVGFGTGAVTQANGVRIVPGGSFELIGVCTTQEIRAIGDIASNANVTTVEG